jgi:lysophospholipase L1-like esterase
MFSRKTVSQQTSPRLLVRVIASVSIAALILATLLLLELSARWSGKFATYGEKTGIGYISPYALSGVKWFRKHEPGSHQRVEVEFSESILVNAEGFIDRDWQLAKEHDKIRIVTLGDSFVEGVGSLHPGANYPQMLESILRSTADESAHITVMNGGIAGSDPVFNLQSLLRVFLKYKPDIIVQSVNWTDWGSDIPVRGGLSRFNEDGTVKLRSPWFEPIYVHSHLFRALLSTLLHYDANLMSRPELHRKQEEATKTICDVLRVERSLAQQSGADLVVVLQPLGWWELRRDKEPEWWHPVMECADEHATKAVDLRQELLATAGSSDSLARLYWPVDHHFNPDGYRAYATIVATAVEPLLASRVRRLAAQR